MRDILILRDPRESSKKCSLTPLRGMPGVRFVSYSPDRRVEAGDRVLLDPDGDPLSGDDAGRGLFLIDCSWRRVKRMRAMVDGDPVRRSLPILRTAYPRKSKTFDDPDAGLASVEALYAAVALLSGPDPELLAEYRFGAEFLELNAETLAGIESPER